MNYHKECLRLIGRGNLDFMAMAHEFAARHPKEFIQIAAPGLIRETKRVMLRLKTYNGSPLPEFEIDGDLLKRCKKEAYHYLGKNQKILAIKGVRALTGWDLLTSKSFVESVESGIV